MSIIQGIRQRNSEGISQEVAAMDAQAHATAIQEAPERELTDDDMVEALSIGMQNYMDGNRHEMDDDEVRGFLANG